jgi:hypothetical protein
MDSQNYYLLHVQLRVFNNNTAAKQIIERYQRDIILVERRKTVITRIQYNQIIGERMWTNTAKNDSLINYN